MLEASMQGCQGFPSVGANLTIDLHVPHSPQPDETHSFQQRQMKESPQQPRVETEVQLRFATASVLTLYNRDKGQGSFISARCSHGSDA